MKSLKKARQSYQPIADHAAMLFFLISKLQQVELMYQYSLSSFIQLFTNAVDNSKSEQIKYNAAEAQKRQNL